MHEGNGSARFKRYEFADRKTADNSVQNESRWFAII
jgi:hypothetical protein